MVWKNAKEESTFTWSSFLKPFDTAVWFLIVGAAILSGCVYFMMDYIDNRGDMKKVEAGLWESMFLAAFTLTGHCLYRPRTGGKRLVMFSTCFLFLLVAAAYTANLASFLVARNQPVVVINDIQDAIKNDFRFCVLQSSTSETFLKGKYPTARLVRKQSIGDTYLALDTFERDVVLTTIGTWNLKNRDIIYNEDCAKEWVGRVVQFATAGFSLKDSAQLCSSLLRDVLNLHMLEMKLDGTFDTIWEMHQQLSTTNNCQDLEDAADGEEDTTALTIENIGGAFIVHTLALVIGVLLTFYDHYRKPFTTAESERKLQAYIKRSSSTSVYENANAANNTLSLVDIEESQKQNMKIDASQEKSEEPDELSTVDALKVELKKQAALIQQKDSQQMEIVQLMKRQLDEMQKDIAVIAKNKTKKTNAQKNN
mmetsp:Transcript_2396/g.3360  ORF Transcript_2396/g.3360 Transcript_2396/m.3360 type:complete len:424 (+) Transcript_2396:492-1763(+)